MVTAISKSLAPPNCGGSMPLNGVNKKCVKGTQECKQWAQVKVIVCPFFKRLPQQAQENGGNAPSLKENQQIGILSVKREKSIVGAVNAKFEVSL